MSLHIRQIAGNGLLSGMVYPKNNMELCFLGRVARALFVESCLTQVFLFALTMTT